MSRVQIARAALAAHACERTEGPADDLLRQGVDGEELSLQGGLHEWFSDDDRSHGWDWLPSMSVLIGLARRAVDVRAGSRSGAVRRAVWIGRRCWPYPPALVWRGPSGTDRRLLHASLFVDPASRQERVWAIELAARCVGVGAVIADGSGLSMAETRRLQLASTNTPLLVARPARESRELSAARTRWRVEPCAIDENESDRCQGWAVELMRCKGLRPEAPEDARRWLVRRNHGAVSDTVGIEHTWHRWSESDGGVAAAMDDGPDASSRQTQGARIA